MKYFITLDNLKVFYTELLKKIDKKAEAEDTEKINRRLEALETAFYELASSSSWKEQE